jgi:cytochrome oxidase Cu insertion factor (SCO1/SenC/PrrC family)
MRWALAVGVAALFLFGVFATALGLRADGDGDDSPFERSTSYRGSEPPSGFQLPSFALRDYTGALVRTGDLRGKVVVITFLDSQCTESCPIIASQLARTIDLLTPLDRAYVEVIALSTDPVEDTKASVRRFLSRQRAIGKLRYLIRPERRIKSIWKSFFVLSSLESGQDTVHSAPVRVYNPSGVWVSTLHAGVDLNPTNLIHDIRTAWTS